MTTLVALFGTRLAHRLFAYQAALFALAFAACGVGQVLLFGTPLEAEHASAVAWAADVTLAASEDPSRLSQQMDMLRVRRWASVTVFDADGHLRATSEPIAPAPLPDPTLLELAAGRTVDLSARSRAVAKMSSGKLVAYAVVTWPSPGSRYLLAVPFAIFLVTIGFGSIPLARMIARPIEKLTKVTREFGLGDLAARASITRHDEMGHLARAFNAMADRVMALRRMEKELLANVSHELRTPLARIRVALELATEEEGSIGRRYLSNIAADLAEVEQILDDIISTARLDLATERAEPASPPLRRTPVALGSLIEVVTDRLQELHPGRSFQTTLDASLIALVDRVHVKHAVANILENAHKYSPVTEAIEIQVRRHSDHVSALVVVTDHGAGIEPGDLERVFEPFFRSDRSRARGTGGVGLGLTLAKRIAEAHGGSISIDTEVGVGTTVTLSLPLEPSDERAH